MSCIGLKWSREMCSVRKGEIAYPLFFLMQKPMRENENALRGFQCVKDVEQRKESNRCLKTLFVNLFSLAQSTAKGGEVLLVLVDHAVCTSARTQTDISGEGLTPLPCV